MRLLEFNLKAKTGDIILFKGLMYCNKCQRFFTRGEYDHTVLVVKKENEIFVYEANSFGVIFLFKKFTLRGVQ